jgi:Flp pilus assembly pilin Flp
MVQYKRQKNQLGQGMTEYIVIVALVAVAAIGVYSAFEMPLSLRWR